MKFSLLSVLAFTLFFISCKQGEPVDLKMNLQPGSQYLYGIETKMTMEQSAMGQTIKVVNNMLMESTYEVQASEGANKRISVSYDRIALSVENPMLNIQYDSKDSAKGDSVLRHMSQLLHKPFTIVVAPSGEVLKVEGLDVILSTLTDSSKLSVSGLFSDSAVRSMMQQSLNIFPDKPVRPGDTWKKSYQYDMSAMGMKVDNEFKLVSVTNGMARIEIKSKIIGGGSMSRGERSQTMKLDLKGEQKGSLDVEVATGLITEGNMEQDVKGTISMMTMTVPVTMKQQVHIAARKK